MNQTNELNLLDSAKLSLFCHSGTLRLIMGEDLCYLSVTLVRAFPQSSPDHYWGLLDGAGKDIGVIADPSALDPASRSAAEEELQKRYFIPRIESVVRTKEDYGSIVWTVKTDKGDRIFTVRNLKDSIIELGGSRVLLVDVDGNRYEIPDITRLDAKSYDLVLRSQ